MLVILFSVAFAALCAADVQKASVVLKTDTISGVLIFTQNGDEVQISGNITGVDEGEHGFHVHEKGDLSDGCTSAGAHFNPNKNNHGAPNDTDRHVGDLGNIKADANKLANVDIVDKQISLNGANSIIGRAVVLHAKPDDLGKGGFNDSKTTGHAGDRLACGVIGILDGAPASNGIAINSSIILMGAALFMVVKQVF